MTKLTAYSCRHIRARLPAYVNRELSPAAARRVSSHLTRCDACYAAYVAQRETARELSAALPRMGGAPRLDAMWRAVQATDAGRAHRMVFRKRYSIGVMLLVIALIVPQLLNEGGIAHASFVATPPTPSTVQRGTPSGQAAVVVMATDAPGDPGVQAESVQLDNTPHITSDSTQAPLSEE